jgi:hypothetical protein
LEEVGGVVVVVVVVVVVMVVVVVESRPVVWHEKNQGEGAVYGRGWQSTVRHWRGHGRCAHFCGCYFNCRGVRRPCSPCPPHRQLSRNDSWHHQLSLNDSWRTAPRAPPAIRKP